VKPNPSVTRYVTGNEIMSGKLYKLTKNINMTKDEQRNQFLRFKGYLKNFFLSKWSIRLKKNDTHIFMFLLFKRQEY
jgi:hypothetical protein